MFSDILKNSSVTYYNDNPGAASALICKAPRLWRADMQCLTRELAMRAIESKTMYWGVKINGDVNEYADALSRFKPYDWKALGFQMRDPTAIVNKYLAKLAGYYPNRSKKDWEWTEQQKEDLRITLTERLIQQRKTHLTKAKKPPSIHNILTKKNFDD